MKLAVRLRDVFLGCAITLFVVVGCASSWKYTHYTLDATALPEPEKGMLRAIEAKDDKPLTACLPSATSKAPCNVMMEDVYFKLKGDFEAMEKRLIACEQRCGGS